jgi:tetratricopeptide (TPR) repeat protein
MIKILFTGLGLLMSMAIQAQLTELPTGGNKKASVSEQVGLTEVTVHYNRPGVKGREGKIWGQLVPYGLSDPGYGSSHAAPWRAGANEITTVRFSTDVRIEGKPLAAGTYAFFIEVNPGNATVIFNKNPKAWGNFFYDPKEDVLRVPVKTQELSQSVEWLKYEFRALNDSAAILAMNWEKLEVPVRIEVDYINTQLATFRSELAGDQGFRPEAWDQAAQFCIRNKVNLEEALTWADNAMNVRMAGTPTFAAMGTKAQVLHALGRNTEEDAIMKEAIGLGSVSEVHMYARQLMQSGRKADAISVFEQNAKKFPNQFTTNVGMARASSAKGDFKAALKYAKAAAAQAPDKGNADNVAKMIEKLEKGQDVN